MGDTHMGVRDCACYVIAIDGFISDARAKAIQQRFEAKALMMMGDLASFRAESVDNSTVSREGRLKVIVTAVRDKDTKVVDDYNIEIYGVFRDGQVTPEHMYFRYGEYLYETGPNDPLADAPASKSNLEFTPFERNSSSFDKSKCRAVKMDAKMSCNQLALLRETFPDRFPGDRKRKRD